MIAIITLMYVFVLPWIEVEGRIEVVPIRDETAPIQRRDPALDRMSEKDLEDAFNKNLKEAETKDKKK